MTDQLRCCLAHFSMLHRVTSINIWNILFLLEEEKSNFYILSPHHHCLEYILNIFLSRLELACGSTWLGRLGLKIFVRTWNSLYLPIYCIFWLSPWIMPKIESPIFLCLISPLWQYVMNFLNLLSVVFHKSHSHSNMTEVWIFREKKSPSIYLTRQNGPGRLIFYFIFCLF